MVKHFLIDGYNLAYKLGVKVTKDNLKQVRDTICQKVATCTVQRKCKVTLVFDGRGMFGTTEPYQHIIIVYTASGETADARIKKMIDEIPTKSTLCVVSSDNEILQYAKVSRAQSMRSEEFLAHLKPDSTGNLAKPKKHRSTQSLNKESTTNDKPSTVSSSEVEELKRLFQ